MTITDVPKDVVEWFFLRGWQITAVTYDDTTVPPTPYYDMSRQFSLE